MKIRPLLVLYFSTNIEVLYGTGMDQPFRLDYLKLRLGVLLCTVSLKSLCVYSMIYIEYIIGALLGWIKAIIPLSRERFRRSTT